MIVSLTPAELRFAAIVGIHREGSNRVNNRTSRDGADPADGWKRHVEGAAGEMAIAKFLGIYWSGAIGNFDAPDVGLLQIRTRSRDYYDLYLNHDDDDGEAFVLLTGLSPTFTVRGWILGGPGKAVGEKRTYRGGSSALYVPRQHLKPIAELLEHPWRWKEKTT